MAISPAAGALSQTQLAVLEQIRALRAAKVAAPVQAAPSIEAKPVAQSTAAQQPLSADTANPMLASRPRGSILNITV